MIFQPFVVASSVLLSVATCHSAYPASTGSLCATKSASASRSIRTIKTGSVIGTTPTASQSTSSASSTSTCVSTISPRFLINSSNSTTYTLDIGKDSSTNQTEYATSPESATPFSIASTCYDSICGVQQLVVNDTTAESGPAIWGAYSRSEGGPITFFNNKTATPSGFVVTAAWSSYTCRLVLIPFLNHDVSEIYDCGGKISLFGFGDNPPGADGCRRVNLTYTAV